MVWVSKAIIMLNLDLNINYKYNRFLKILLEKSLKFVLNKKNNIIVFNLRFVLLLVEMNLILKKQSHQKDAFIICDISRIKIIFVLLSNMVVFYI